MAFINRKLIAPVGICAGVVITQRVLAGPEDPNAAHGLDPMVLVGVALMLIAAKLGGEVVERLGQPAVLGELISGIVMGNLVLIGFSGAEPLKTDADH